MGMPAGFLILPWELGWMCRAGGNTPGNCPSAGSGAGPGNADLLQFPKDGISGIQGLVPGVWEWEIIPRLDNGQLINNSSASQLSANSSWDKEGRDFSGESMEKEAGDRS